MPSNGGRAGGGVGCGVGGVRTCRSLPACARAASVLEPGVFFRALRAGFGSVLLSGLLLTAPSRRSTTTRRSRRPSVTTSVTTFEHRAVETVTTVTRRRREGARGFRGPLDDTARACVCAARALFDADARDAPTPHERPFDSRPSGDRRGGHVQASAARRARGARAVAGGPRGAPGACVRGSSSTW